jgi:ATP-dependent helicase YprA (DUF1998 family)
MSIPRLALVVAAALVATICLVPQPADGYVSPFLPSLSPRKSLHCSAVRHQPARALFTTARGGNKNALATVMSAVGISRSSELSEFSDAIENESPGLLLDVEETEEEEERDPSDVRNFPISDETMDALASRGISKLFPVQTATFNEIYAGRDVLARARTGTGKTLGFALPIIERLLADKKANDGKRRRRGQKPSCIILSPTRELAQQVEREVEALALPSATMRVNSACVYGGVSYSKQERELRDGVDIVVGTPGRLIDLMKNGMLDLSEIRYLVLDEADEMLNR